MTPFEPVASPFDKSVAGRTAYVILHNASEVVTPDAEGRKVIRHPRGAVVFRDARVLEVGDGPTLLRRHGEARPVNAGGRLVTPGLVDCHTHMIFAGQRAGELQRRLAGEDYEAIAAAGGGIGSTVRATSEAPDDVLEKSLAGRLERWRANGCTTVEVKSGYASSPPGEVRLLELIRAAAQRVPTRVHATALMLHAPPADSARDRWIAAVCDEALPTAQRRGLATAVDAFCDGPGFGLDECRRVLERGRELGFAVKLHAEQFEHTGAARLAAELGAASADHLERATDEDWRALAAAGTVGVLLPAAALTLGQPLPPAGRIRAAGARFAIATDFNPGTAPAQSLLECGALASRLCGFSAEEVLLALTWNAARALGAAGEVGHLTPGACADAVTWECETLEELPYWMPAVRPDCVFMRGADLALPAVERRVWP